MWRSRVLLRHCGCIVQSKGYTLIKFRLFDIMLSELICYPALELPVTFVLWNFWNMLGWMGYSKSTPFDFGFIPLLHSECICSISVLSGWFLCFYRSILNAIHLSSTECISWYYVILLLNQGIFFMLTWSAICYFDNSNSYCLNFRSEIICQLPFDCLIMNLVTQLYAF